MENDITGMVRTDDHSTSIGAAGAVVRRKGTIRQRVLAEAQLRGERGITDFELGEIWPDAPESSYRKRRTELAQDGLLRDSGRERVNKFGRSRKVWVATEGQR